MGKILEFRPKQSNNVVDSFKELMYSIEFNELQELDASVCIAWLVNMYSVENEIDAKKLAKEVTKLVNISNS